jgi:hypothetical protein
LFINGGSHEKSKRRRDLFGKLSSVENNDGGSTSSDGINRSIFVSHLCEGLVRFLLSQLK